MSRSEFIKAVTHRNRTSRIVYGTGTSIACRELMETVDAWFPEAHLDAEDMTALAMAGHTVLGFDVVMPLFSVCHEAAAMGCDVNFGRIDMMPEAGKPIFQQAADIRVPDDLLTRPGCAVPCRAISLLRKRLGNDAAVCGKVMGPWTQAYHYFGVENFLIGTLDDPGETRRILDALLPVTVAFAEAQIEAGADCLLLADHATRDLCSPKAYRDFVAPLHKELAERLSAPLALHICGDTTDRIGMIGQTGLGCFHWDTKSGAPAKVRELAGDSLSLMGGISNLELLQSTPDEITNDAVEAAESQIDIVGPECAIPLTTPLANLKAIVAAGREIPN